MWFRIEVEKDGAIKSCVEVSGSFVDKRHVFYIEAESKGKALSLVARFLATRENDAKKQKQRRDRKAKAGLCQWGGCDSPGLAQEKINWVLGNAQTGSEAYCLTHKTVKQAAARARRAGELPKREVRTPLERALLRKQTQGSEYDRKHGTLPERLLRKCLALFDENPETLRPWLVSEIARYEGRRAARQDTRPQAAE